ncbi:helix-turn-helix transcriptional regulator [Flammeovirga sp. OC4]|uniref:helix-turn-helix transcriptional regulator n=1 Tax=Flammeovirga sp. OC4 TaxID=1382345 RepID=UPI0006934532|nr:helix-turn-helix transcriptional regulator [Flammeovirga sp. OC4]
MMIENNIIPFQTITKSLQLYQSFHAPQPTFGVDIYNDTITDNDVVILSNNGQGNKGVPMRCDHYIVIKCLQGSAFRRINHHNFSIYPHSIHIIKPGQIASLTNISSDFEIQVLLFHQDHFQKLGLQYETIENLLTFNESCIPYFELDKENLEVYHQLFQQIENEVKNKYSFKTNILNGYLLALMGYIQRKLYFHKSEEEGTNSQQNLFLRYKKSIETHFIVKKTVQEYADLLAITPKHLSETIKQLTGQRALYFIHERLINEAEYLLTYTKEPISHIAFTLNFDTVSHFGRFFKKYKEITPVEYRKRLV